MAVPFRAGKKKTNNTNQNKTDMNTTEFHSETTFKRCHGCSNNLHSHANTCQRNGTIKPDHEDCNTYDKAHSGHIHDLTDAVNGMLDD